MSTQLATDAQPSLPLDTTASEPVETPDNNIDTEPVEAAPETPEIPVETPVEGAEGNEPPAPVEEPPAAPDPLNALLEERGGVEGILPAVETYEALLQAQTPNDIFAAIEQVHPNATPVIGWSFIDQNLEDVVADQKVREAFVASDPDYQRYLQLKESGQLDEIQTEEEQLDPNNPKDREILEYRAKERERQQQEAIQQQQAQQQAVAAYNNNVAQYTKANVIDWLHSELTSQINWGDENKDLLEDIEAAVVHRFDNNPKAVSALKRAQETNYYAERYAAIAKQPGATAEQKQQAVVAKQKAENDTKIVRNYLGALLKPRIEANNKRIQTLHQATKAARAAQEKNPLLTPAASVNAPGTTGKLPGVTAPTNPNDLLKALMDKARAEGRLQGYDGY